jgi:hypothetical protein
MTMTMQIQRFLGLAAAAAVLSGCSVTGPDGGEKPGIIETRPGSAEQVTVPATAPRGEPFTVTVITHGGGCLSQGPTRVRIHGTTAEVRPYDVDNGSDICTADVEMYEHTATLRFDQPGTATVRVHGRQLPGGDAVVVTRTVTIQ